jgi:hypothetical protein
MNHVVHTVHAVCPILFCTTNRAAGAEPRGTRGIAASGEQDKRNRVNSVNRVSQNRRRWGPPGDPGSG